MGYYRAGFTDIVGVDIRPQPRYPFQFVQADAMTFPLVGFDLIHASPPCQAYSRARNNGCHPHAPRLVEPLQEWLDLAEIPFVIENVPGAPLRNPILLCGAAFGLGARGLELCRHRLFESSIPLRTPGCQHTPGKTMGVYGHGMNAWHRKKHGFDFSVKLQRTAMGIDWMIRAELTQAIPPAYTEYIGRQFLVQRERG